MAKVSEVTFGSGLPMPGTTMQGGASAEGNGFSEIMKQASEASEQSGEDLMNMTKGLSAGKDNSGVQKSENASAKDAQTKPAAKSEQTAAKTDKTEKTEKTDKSADVKETASETKVTDTKEANTPEGEQIGEEEAEVLAAQVNAILEAVASLLDVEPEQVVDMLEELGLQVTDLTTAGNAADLLASLKGISGADIVTSEEMTDLVKEISTVVTEDLGAIAQDLGISTEELAGRIEEAFAKVAEAAVAEPEEQMQISVESATFAPAKEVTGEREVAIQSEPETVASDVADPVAATQTATVKEDHSGAKDSRSDSRGSDSGRHTENVAAANVQQTQAQQAPVEAQAPRFEESLSAARTQEVIDQIAEHVKTTGGDNKLTGIEMMLNPANLGSIKLQLETNNGVIRGQLTASDEAVRAALESQILQLKEALAEQGMKVDALEVTVAGHELEQNLDQSGQEAQQEAERLAGQKSGRRILDLSDPGFEEEEQELTDGEKLEVEMMKMGGNRLNYQV